MSQYVNKKLPVQYHITRGFHFLTCQIAKSTNYNPQNEMYQKLKRKVHFLAGVERGKGNKKHG